MRSRKILFMFGLMMVMGLGLVLSGCSSDDRPTPPTPTIDEQYSFVLAEVNSMIERSITLMGTSVTTFESVSQINDTAVVQHLELSAFEPDSIGTSNYWYILYGTELATSYVDVTVDSLLFTANGSPVEFASAADAMELHHLWNHLAFSKTETYTDYETSAIYTFSGMNTAEATITGSVELIGEAKNITADSTTVRNFTIEVNYTSLTIDKSGLRWDAACPASGAVTCTVTLSYQYGSETAETSTWTASGNFTNGSLLGTIGDGTVSTIWGKAFCTP